MFVTNRKYLQGSKIHCLIEFVLLEKTNLTDLLYKQLSIGPTTSNMFSFPESLLLFRLIKHLKRELSLMKHVYKFHRENIGKHFKQTIAKTI